MNKLWRGLPLVLSCAVLLVFPCLGDEDPVEKRFQSVSVMDVTFAGENGVVVLNASSFNSAVAMYVYQRSPLLSVPKLTRVTNLCVAPSVSSRLFAATIPRG